MAKEQKSVFKNAVGGYQKKEVNEYIASLSQEAARREALYEKEKGKLERALADSHAEKEQLEGIRDELACSLYEAEAECSALRRENEEIAARLAAAEALSAEQKKMSNDEICEDLSDMVDKIMNAAGNSAREIVNNALHRADEIVAQANAASENIRREAAMRSDELTEKAKETYATAATYYDGVTDFAMELRESLDRLMREIEEKRTDVTSKIEWLKIAEASAAPVTEAATPETESDAKKALSSLDEKIEEFFRNTMAAIRKMTEK